MILSTPQGGFSGKLVCFTMRIAILGELGPSSKLGKTRLAIMIPSTPQGGFSMKPVLFTMRTAILGWPGLN